MITAKVTQKTLEAKVRKIAATVMEMSKTEDGVLTKEELLETIYALSSASAVVITATASLMAEASGEDFDELLTGLADIARVAFEQEMEVSHTSITGNASGGTFDV